MPQRYTKLDNGGFRVTFDGGQYDLTRSPNRIHARLENVERMEKRFVGPGENERVRTPRYISARWKPAKYRAETVSEEGINRIDAPILVHIAPGKPEQSLVFHAEDFEIAKDTLSFNLHPTEEVFDWLWNEIGARANPVVGFSAMVPLLHSAMESHNFYEDPFPHIRLAHEDHVNITEVEIAVTDASPLNRLEGVADDEVETAADLTPHLVERLASQMQWLPYIFAGLVALIVVQYFKH
ncbi:MAG: hypothetical protein ACTHPD_15495 [Rhizomicrobium sp.]